VKLERGDVDFLRVFGCEFADMLSFDDVEVREQFLVQDTKIQGALRMLKLRSQPAVSMVNDDIGLWLDVGNCELKELRLDHSRIGGRLNVAETNLDEFAAVDSSVRRMVWFSETTLQKVEFQGCDLSASVDLSGLTGAPGISAERSTLGDGLQFAEDCVLNCRGTRFLRRVGISGRHVAAGSRFDRAIFEGGASIDNCTFDEDAMFEEATFKGPVRFHEVTVTDAARFKDAVFERPSAFIGMSVAHRLELDGAWFQERATLQATASRLAMVGTRFGSGGTIRVEANSIDLSEAEFGGPSLLAVAREAQTVPRVVSIRGANVEGLTLSGLDLSECRFHRAHNLDKLRLETDASLGSTPRWSLSDVLSGRGWPWTRRRVLAEESELRCAGDGARAAGWHPPAPRPDRREPLSPTQLAEIYRGLRKGREDNKDEPGAADFYYGEMEMRRAAGRQPDSTVPRAEHTVLTLYWLVSGYALRASRALIALALLVLLGAVLLDAFGFRPDRAFGRSLLYSIESTVSLLRAPTAKLTAGGEVVQIVLRLAGPLLFGLALLSLRGRVKR
jgi:uncharacterized protein YjbI with pentapeptide repeats